jgi:hypothetical protein
MKSLLSFVAIALIAICFGWSMSNPGKQSASGPSNSCGSCCSKPPSYSGHAFAP